jgi:PAS domain S-box-containing protein
MSAGDATGANAAPVSVGAGDAQLRLLVDGITDHALCLLDPAGVIASWNTGAARIAGYAAAEIVGQPFSVFYTLEDRVSGFPEQALATARRDGRCETEGWRLRKDGSQFWATTTLDRLTTEVGQVIGFAAVTRDDTERRGGRQALCDSERRFRLLVESVVDYAIFMLDPAGHVTNWNAGGRRITGYTAEEIIGRHFSTFYTGEDRANGIPDRSLAIAAREGRYEADGWRQRKDGSRFWASVVIDAIRAEDGALLGFAKVTRDISERKKAQDALDETRAVLAQSQKMEAIGQLTGGIAHDFNNLLTVIASNADLLGRPQLGDKQRRKLIEGIQRASDRGARLTQQLLAFARRQPLRPETHSIRALIGNFEVVLRRAGGDTAELQLDLGREADFARIDAPQFEAALLNLVVNARDALPQGGTIRLKTRIERIGDGAGARGMKPGEYVVVTIEDDGTGMAQETLERAFEPFFTTKETGKGSGLGLSQVYGFVVQSGGQVKLASSVGGGTTVTLYLPTDAKAQKEAAATETQAQGNAGTVLVVEDDPDVMEAALSMLQSLGYDVMTAPDGPTALTTLRREQGIDVLFTDVVMPNGVSGVELARQARRLRPEIKVLLVSGYPTAVLSAEHGLTGEFAFLSKPYRWAELAERLRGARRAL